MPGNDDKFSNTELAKFYDDYAKKMYANFEKVLMQIPCEADSTSRYSLVRDCDDCKAAYKKWLCTVSIPRCDAITSDNDAAIARNVGQPFPNDTKLPDDLLSKYEGHPYNNASRNSFIDTEVQPGPYKEILPCEDICYEVVQSCPAAMGFTCPQPHMTSFSVSYGRRAKDGSTVACNYPGEARTPVSDARAVVPKMALLGAVSTLVMTALATV